MEGEVSMVRKAEQARRASERTVPGKAKAPAKKRRDVPVDTSQPGVSASDRKIGKGATAKRNVSQAAEKKASWVLEDSTTDTPSRKSTRKAANHAKPDSNLRQRETRETTSPTARARRATARKGAARAARGAAKATRGAPRG